MTTYEPGTVAVATVRGVPNVRVMRSRNFWLSSDLVSGTNFHGREGDLAGDIRPLAVIDPEDREQVKRLVGLFFGQFPAASESEDDEAMQAALREFAKPSVPIYMTTGGLVAPWPVVNECHSGHRAGHECPQCAWEHEHEWIEWTGDLALTGSSTPIRCSKCGGRKCDAEDCALQRHHTGGHEGVLS